MTRLTLMLLGVSLSLGFAPVPKVRVPRAELKKLEGTWRIKEFANRGRKVTTSSLREKIRFVFKGTQLRIRIRMREVLFEMKCNSRAKPKALDLLPKRKGTNKLFAIYQFQGQMLKFAWSRAKRPRNFDEKQKGTGVFTLERVGK